MGCFLFLLSRYGLFADFMQELRSRKSLFDSISNRNYFVRLLLLILVGGLFLVH